MQREGGIGSPRTEGKGLASVANRKISDWTLRISQPKPFKNDSIIVKFSVSRPQNADIPLALPLEQPLAQHCTRTWNPPKQTHGSEQLQGYRTQSITEIRHNSLRLSSLSNKCH